MDLPRHIILVVVGGHITTNAAFISFEQFLPECFNIFNQLTNLLSRV